MANQVSSCCGRDYQEQEDEDRFNFYVCDSCNREFDNTIMDYDWEDLMREERLEENANE